LAHGLNLLLLRPVFSLRLMLAAATSGKLNSLTAGKRAKRSSRKLTGIVAEDGVKNSGPMQGEPGRSRQAASIHTTRSISHAAQTRRTR
jgi:hypothetical protein